MTKDEMKEVNKIADLEEASIPVKTVRVLLGMKDARLLALETVPDEMGLIDGCQRQALKVRWNEPGQGARKGFFDLETGTYMGDTI